MAQFQHDAGALARLGSTRVSPPAQPETFREGQLAHGASACVSAPTKDPFHGFPKAPVLGPQETPKLK